MDLPVQETRETNSKSFSLLKQHKMWLQMTIYSSMVLTGQSSATLLGRLYYEKGGKSKYIAALMQSAGFPVLLPLLYLTSRKNRTAQRTSPSPSPSPSPGRALPLLYICFGTFLAFDSMLYSVGLMYLPLSTFSLICATQLGFNAVFSYFINSQKLTPSILNSIFLLSLSSVLLVLQPETSTDASRNRNHVLGFVCTITGVAGYALLLSVEQMAYRKVLERQTIAEILNVIFFESLVATGVLLVGLFGSGEWRGLKAEAMDFESGGKSYATVFVLGALGWQVFAVGMVALILKVSSLFGNVVSTMNVPVIPVLAVVVFQDKMSGLKVVAMVLAVWGCVSYVYQQYVDDVKSRVENADLDVVTLGD